MSFFSEYENLIQDINEDIAAGIITANDYQPVSDYYYMSNHPKVKYEAMRICDVLQELVLRNMMR